MRRTWALLLSLVALASGQAQAASSWTFVTEPFPPYTYADKSGRAAGPMVDVLERVCQKLERHCTIEVMPWRRALRLAEEGQVDGIFTLLATAERRTRFYISPPVLAARYTLFSRAGESYVYSDRESLRGRTVAAYGPSGTSQVLDDVSQGLEVNKVLEADNPTALRKLLAGRYGEHGLVLMNEAVALHLIQQLVPTGLQTAGVVRQFDYSFGLVRKRVSQKDAQAFGAALTGLCLSGQSAALIGHYGLSASPCKEAAAKPQ